ncbi:hypothetical protein [Leptospira kanakyensis]|uniref:hypothetical protein n=1 Tax=Leptospira kanakyensis TaxID=2484968 RepID=UPI00223DE935|nr:hypothetical protein [Leptospira kanakyensis]MCW7482134.1 U32 family peptidase [Leptospira kanakyensis]
MEIFLINHADDLSWIRENYGINAEVIAHEDYIKLLVDEDIPCIFTNYLEEIGDGVNYITFNWHRDVEGNDLSKVQNFSIAEVLSVGLWPSISSVCREYFAVKRLLESYDFVHISINEPKDFREITQKFGDKIKIFDPNHRNSYPLISFNERHNFPSLINWKFKVIRRLQTFLIPFLQKRTVALADWTYKKIAPERNWLLINSRKIWQGAYLSEKKDIDLNSAYVCNLEDLTNWSNVNNLSSVLMRKSIHWDNNLLELLSLKIEDRYRKYKEYFREVVGAYQEFIDKYNPVELILPADLYEPHNIAGQLAKTKGIKVSLLADGFPVVEIKKIIGSKATYYEMVDRIYATGCHHSVRLKKDFGDTKDIVTIKPHIANFHSIAIQNIEEFDCIVMTYIPLDYNPLGRNGYRPVIVLDLVYLLNSLGIFRIAIKIKSNEEKEWLKLILEKNNLFDSVEIIEGRFHDHVKRTRFVIGGISSAIGESAFQSIPYYVYEPIENGYGSELIYTSNIIKENSIARTLDELRELLKCPDGSVINDRDLLFGTNCERFEN